MWQRDRYAAAPAYVASIGPARTSLRYLWDDTRASKDFGADAAWVIAGAARCAVRAQMALCIGLYEWVLFRFDGLHDRIEPLQLLEAAWCATIDPRCLAFADPSRSDWQGPVLGPLWCAMTWLRPALVKGDALPADMAETLHYLAREALHVWPDPARVATWLKRVLPRLAELFPAVPDDPFVDLFDDASRRRRSPLVTPAALDPDAPYPRNAGPGWARAVLQDAAVGDNPLVTPAWQWDDLLR